MSISSKLLFTHTHTLPHWNICFFFFFFTLRKFLSPWFHTWSNWWLIVMIKLKDKEPKWKIWQNSVTPSKFAWNFILVLILLKFFFFSVPLVLIQNFIFFHFLIHHLREERESLWISVVERETIGWYRFRPWKRLILVSMSFIWQWKSHLGVLHPSRHLKW